MNSCVAPHLLTPYHPRQAARARRYARALTIARLEIELVSDRIYRHLIAAGDEMAAKHVRRTLKDQADELDDYLRPKWLDAIDGWARATPSDELRRLRIAVPDKVI